MKRIRLRVLVLLGAASMAVVLGGCGSMAPLPSDTFYRIQIDSPPRAGAITRPLTDQRIRVAKFHASGVHRERPIAFTEQGGIVVKQHRYHLWIDSPERMLQDELISYLRAIRASPKITAADLSGEGIEIRTWIRQMDRAVNGEASSAVVVLAFEVMSVGARDTLIFDREYQESRAVSGNDLNAVATAISAACAAVFERFVADLGGALR